MGGHNEAGVVPLNVHFAHKRRDVEDVFANGLNLLFDKGHRQVCEPEFNLKREVGHLQGINPEAESVSDIDWTLQER